MAEAVVIIGCGKAKQALARGVEVPIVDLYTGSLYRARLDLAEALGGPDFILSALHGLVEPLRPSATYESDLRKMSKREREAWTDRVLHALKQSVPRGSKLVVIAAGPYVDWVHWARLNGYEIEIPAEGMELGTSIGELRRLAREARAGNVGAMADEVERELPTYRDDEEAILPVTVLRELLRRASARSEAA